MHQSDPRQLVHRIKRATLAASAAAFAGALALVAANVVGVTAHDQAARPATPPSAASGSGHDELAPAAPTADPFFAPSGGDGGSGQVGPANGLTGGGGLPFVMSGGS